MSARPDLDAILAAAPDLPALADWLAREGLPEAWLAAGCVNQTIWNHLSARPPRHGILDYDVVYYDPDLSPETEAAWSARLSAAFPGLKLDVKNQARVHLWYPRKFGLEIPQLASVHAALCTWPTTATATAVRRAADGGWDWLLPFGPADLTAMIIRPNCSLVSEPVYLAKAARWQSLWPELRVLPWEQAVGPFEINGPVDLNPGRA